MLGGYGNTGRWLVRLLLQETTARLVIAGRSREQAEAAAAACNRAFDGARVSARAVDAADGAALRAALAGARMVVVASSTAAHAGTVARAALAAGTDYLDLQYATAKRTTLQGLAREIARAGRCFITDAGFHPGLPAALIRYVAPCFDRLDRAVVGSVIQIDWKGLAFSDATMPEFVEELKDFQGRFFRDGQWRQARWSDTQDFLRMDFGPPFGERVCMPMWLEEMRTIPLLYPSLRAAGFYVGGLNPVVDFAVLPLATGALRLWPRVAVRPMARLLRWGLRTFSKPPYGTLLKVEAAGQKDGRAEAVSVTLQHEDAYAFTAIPVAACLLQYLDGTIRRPGLVDQANAVAPARFFHDVERMGVAMHDGTRRLQPVSQ